MTEVRRPFRGWPDEAIEFFDRLEVDNTKQYWETNKDVYLTKVRAPMDALLAELAAEFGPGKVFRPYRDVRFSNDKSPYKTSISATVGPLGYVSLSAAGLGAGSGLYHMAPDQLARYRAAVDEETSGTALASLADTLRDAGHELIAHGTLKTAPKGYPRDHPRIDLLRSKGLTAWHLWEPARWLATPAAKARVVDLLHAAQPLERWIDEHIGASTEPGRGR